MKVPFIDSDLLTSVLYSKPIRDITTQAINSKMHVSLTTSRSSTIPNNFVNHIISVYNGKMHKRIYIKNGMIGFKLGEFVFTKKLGSSVHNSERNARAKAKMRRKITQKKVRKTVTLKKGVKKPTKVKK